MEHLPSSLFKFLCVNVPKNVLKECFYNFDGNFFLFQNVKNELREIFLYIHKFDHEASSKFRFGCWCCESAIGTVPKSHYISGFANSSIIFVQFLLYKHNFSF